MTPDTGRRQGGGRGPKGNFKSANLPRRLRKRHRDSEPKSGRGQRCGPRGTGGDARGGTSRRDAGRYSPRGPAGGRGVLGGARARARADVAGGPRGCESVRGELRGRELREGRGGGRRARTFAISRLAPHSWRSWDPQEFASCRVPAEGRAADGIPREPAGEEVGREERGARAPPRAPLPPAGQRPGPGVGVGEPGEVPGGGPAEDAAERPGPTSVRRGRPGRWTPGRTS